MYLCSSVSESLSLPGYKGSSVSESLSPSGRRVSVSVSGSGCGGERVSEKQRERVLVRVVSATEREHVRQTDSKSSSHLKDLFILNISSM